MGNYSSPAIPPPQFNKSASMPASDPWWAHDLRHKHFSGSYYIVPKPWPGKRLASQVAAAWFGMWRGQ